jgi:hypothetical protein
MSANNPLDKAYDEGTLDIIEYYKDDDQQQIDILKEEGRILPGDSY